MKNKFSIIVAIVISFFICFTSVKAYDMGTKNCYYSYKGERQTYFVKMTLYGLGTFSGNTVAIDTYYYNNNSDTKYEEFSVNNFDGQNYVYNYNLDFGIKFSLDTHMWLISDRVADGEEELLDNNNDEACPSNVYKVSYLDKSNKKQLMFFVCNGYNSELSTDTCANAENFISNSDEFGSNPIVTKHSFTNSTGFNNVGQSDNTQTNIGDTYDDIEEQIEDVCNEESDNYDAIECQNLKDQKTDLEDQAGDLSGNQLEGSSDVDMTQGITPIEFCTDPNVLKVIKIIGYVFLAIKILVPLLLIILGTVDFAKAMISSDDKSNKEALGSLVRRIIIAVIIFIIPTLLNYILVLVDGAIETTSKFSKCTTCLLNTSKCDLDED